MPAFLSLLHFFQYHFDSHAICDSRYFSEGKIFGLVADTLHGRSQEPVVVSPTDWFVRENISALSFSDCWLGPNIRLDI